MGSGGYIECCRPVVQPCSCHPTPDHPSMGIPALHNVRAAWSDSPSTLSRLCWSTDQLLFKMHNMRAAWSAGEQHDLNFVDQLTLLFNMIRFRWGQVPEDVKKVTMTWHHNNITAIPDWAQKDKVANNGGFGKSEFHSHGNWILMARSSKNWQTHSIVKFQKGKWNAKLSESDSDRELRGDYFYQLQTSSQSKLRKKSINRKRKKKWPRLKDWIKEQLRENTCDNCLSKEAMVAD